MSVNIINNYNLNASIFLDSRKSIESLSALRDVSSAGDILYPHGFEVFCIEEGAYYINVSPNNEIPEWEQRITIDDEETSFTTTYSSKKISELLKDSAGINDNIISPTATFSSQKIMELIGNGGGGGIVGGTNPGANINDEEPSAITTYSSQKIESVFSELRQESVRIDDELLDMDNRVDYLEGEMWKLYGFDGSYDSLTNKPSLENYATKEYVDEAVANNDGGSGLPLLSSICMKNEDGSLVITSGVRPMDFELIPKDETVVYLDDITNTSVYNNAYLGLYKDGELTNVTLRLSSVFPIVSIGYRTNTQQLVFGNTFNTILCDLTDGTRTTQNSYSLSAKANSSDILTKTNTTEYTPSANYHPATKKYVDDAIIQSVVGGDVDLSGYATKEYVDNSIPIRVAPVSNMNIASAIIVINDISVSGFYTLPKRPDGSAWSGLLLQVKANDGTVKNALLNGYQHYPFEVNLETQKIYIDNLRVVYTIGDTAETTSIVTEPYYLPTNNTKEYTPTADYHPVTKKYVDDMIAQNPGGVKQYNIYDITESIFGKTGIINIEEMETCVRYGMINFQDCTTFVFVIPTDDAKYRTIVITAPSELMHYYVSERFTEEGRDYIVLRTTNTDYVIDVTDKSTQSSVTYEINDTENYLQLNNTNEFIPTADYHPATKKYVDDMIAQNPGGGGSTQGVTQEDILQLFVELDVVQPLVDENGYSYTDSDGKIFIL